MAGRIITIDEKIEKAQDNVVKIKEKYDEALRSLEDLVKKKKAMQNETLLRVIAESPKTYDEAIEFFTDGMTEEQIAKIFKKNAGRRPGSKPGRKPKKQK